ncbi:MAG: DNA alkylation repair protein [Bacteroidales bacterium]|nr:DNA alkylation repair protein [Bacteroidales bacterium]
MNYHEVMNHLRQLANPEVVNVRKRKFGVISQNALGIYHKDLKPLAQQIGKDNELALQLFDSGIFEARILCSKIFDPNVLTEELMEKWITYFDNWEFCDSFSMGVFAKSKFAVTKAHEWSHREAEFEKRAAFATMASYCMADKKADNRVFEDFLPVIIRESNDNRLYVKKAVNWALRNIGKRNIDLQQKALVTANTILRIDTPPARWIAKDALRELTADKVNRLDYPRSVYRP